MAPETAKKLGVETGDWIDITTYRPKGHAYRAGEEAAVGTLRNRVRVVPGQHPRVIACSHHAGHWEQGTTARAASASSVSPSSAVESELRSDLWWSEERGGVGNGEALNHVLPINPQPLVGGQNWFDNVCRIRRVET